MAPFNLDTHCHDGSDATVARTVDDCALLQNVIAHSSKVVIGGGELDSDLEAAMTTVFDIASRCPVLSVPSGFASTGVRTGVHVVGPSRPGDQAGSPKTGCCVIQAPRRHRFPYTCTTTARVAVHNPVHPSTFSPPVEVECRASARSR